MQRGNNYKNLKKILCVFLYNYFSTCITASKIMDLPKYYQRSIYSY